MLALNGFRFLVFIYVGLGGEEERERKEGGRVYVTLVFAGFYGNQRKSSGPQELELQIVVSP